MTDLSSQVLHQIQVGPEVLCFGLITSECVEPVGIGRIEGVRMRQYIPIYQGKEALGKKWQWAALGGGRYAVAALFSKNQLNNQTAMLALAGANRSRQVLGLQSDGTRQCEALRVWSSRPELARVIEPLQALDTQAFQQQLVYSKPSLNLLGAFECIQRQRARGWVFIEDQADHAVTVLIRTAQGELVGFGEASAARLDLKMLGVCDHPCGFEITLSPRVIDGQAHSLYAIEESSEQLIQISPVIVQEPHVAMPDWVLMDLPTTLQHLDETCPTCPSDQRLLMEKLALLVELGNPLADTYFAAALGLDEGLSWLVQIKRAEYAWMKTGQPREAARLLNQAANVHTQHADAIRLCLQLLQMNSLHSSLSL